MNIIVITILAAAAIMLASLVGVVSVHATVGRKIYANLPFLVSFAAGVLLLSAIYLAIESIHILGSLALVVLVVLAGYLLVWLVDFIWPQFHHHHDEECASTHKSGRRVLFGDGIHNIADGLVLVPAFMASPTVGLGVTISVLTHELLQEISEFFVLRQAGYSTARALAYNFLVSSTILIGVGIGFVVSQTQLLQGILLALSAGFFINIVLHDLLPHHHGDVSKKSLPLHLVMIIVGMLLIGGINQIFVHSHSHSEGDAHDHLLDSHHHDEHEDEHEEDENDHHEDENHDEPSELLELEEEDHHHDEHES